MLALVCIAPDGDFQVEFENFDFENMQEARDHDASMGSRWYFYPVHVIADADTYEIVEAPELFDFLVGHNYREITGSDVGKTLIEACEWIYDYYA